MKPEYLGQQWSEITRDERHFCFDLILQLKLNNTEANFISWLIEAAKLELDESFDGYKYEIDIEVCYYRDLIFRHEYQNGKRFADKKLIKGFLKRTFDFCIFLPKDIIIIEAKAAKGMTSPQLNEFKKDKKAIKICHKYLGLPPPKVHTIALVSKEYFEKSSWLKEQDKMNGYFDNIINWEQIQNDSGSDYHMPNTLAHIFSHTGKMSIFDTINTPLVSELKMIDDMEDKIRKIREMLKSRCIIKATDFDHNYAEAIIQEDPNGARWNKFVHGNCKDQGFEIWKDGSGYNYYVRSTDECRNEALGRSLYALTK